MVNGEVHAAVNGRKNPGCAFPFTFILLRVCAFMCLFDVMSENVTHTQLYWQQRYHNPLHCTTRKQQLLCEHVFVQGKRRQGERFWAGLITIQPLFNPALPLSTYNMAACPLARLQMERNLQMPRRGRSEGA